MSRENSNVAAIAVIIIAGLFLLALLGGAAFLVLGLFAVRSSGPLPAPLKPVPTMTVSPGPPVMATPADAAGGDIPLVIDADGTMKADGIPQNEEQLRQFFASYKAAEKIPTIFAHQDAPPDRLERAQQLCTEIVGLTADVKIVSTVDAPMPNVIPPAAAPAEAPAP